MSWPRIIAQIATSLLSSLVLYLHRHRLVHHCSHGACQL